MGRGGSVSGSVPPMPDFSGMGGSSARAIKRNGLKERKEREHLTIKMN